MSVINTANKIYSGTSVVSKVYAGANLVWPSYNPVGAWKAAVIAAGGTVSSTREGHLNTLVNGLIADGVWAKLDRLWVFGAENTQSALIDLKALDQAAEVNSPTFTANKGYAGNGFTSYINTTFNAATQGVNYTLNSANVSIWCNGNFRPPATVAQTGVLSGSSLMDLLSYTAVFGPVGLGFRMNGGGAALTSSADAGVFTAQRTGTTAIEGFIDGTSAGTGAAGSVAVVSLPFFVCGRNDDGGLAIPTSDSIAAASYGGGLTSTQMANYYSRLQSYSVTAGVSP